MIITLNKIIIWLKARPVRSGTFAGWFQQLCSAGGAILVIPLIISSLSDADSGLWFTFQGLVALAGLCDFGLGFVVARQVAYTLKRNENCKDADINDFLNFGSGGAGVQRIRTHVEKIYHYTGAVAVIIGVLIFELVLPYTRALEGVSPDSRIVWYLMLATTLFMLFGNRWSSILIGANNVFLSKLLLGFFYLFQAVTVGITALVFKSLVAMGLATVTVALAYFLLVRNSAKQHIPELRETTGRDRASLDRILIRQLWRVSMPVGVTNLTSYLISTVQVPMLGALFGPASVAPYYLAQRILQFGSTLVLQPVPPQLTSFTSFLSNNNSSQSLVVFRQTLRFIIPANLLVAVGFVFISPWAAKVLAQGKTYPDATILTLMALNALILGTSATGAQFVMASGKNPFMTACIINGMLNLAGLAWLVPHYGIIGIPLAAIISGLMSSYLWGYYKTYHLRLQLMRGILT